MAKLSPNIPALPAEGVSVSDSLPPRQTHVESAFVALLEALAGFIAEERAIADVDILDPAFANWLRDAELAHEKLVDSLHAVDQAPLRQPQDRPLRILARLIEAMIGSEDPTTFGRLYRQIPRHQARLFHCGGGGMVAGRVNRLLALGREHIDALAALAIFEGAAPAACTRESGGEADPALGQIAA